MVTGDHANHSISSLFETNSTSRFLPLEEATSTVKKILTNPQVGKPLRYTRGERSLYLKPFRIIYAVRDGELILLKFDHRKRAYKS